MAASTPLLFHGSRREKLVQLGRKQRLQVIVAAIGGILIAAGAAFAFSAGSPTVSGVVTTDILAVSISQAPPTASWEGMTLHMLGDRTLSQQDCKGAVVNISYSATP